MCVLHVCSNTDSFTKFLQGTRLPVYRSHEKGDARKARKAAGALHEDYGFSCTVSEREWSDLPGQVADAIRFLTDYAADLRSLTADHRVDDLRLDFPITSRLSEKVIAQFDYLPPPLLRLCAEYGIGIELSNYAASS